MHKKMLFHSVLLGALLTAFAIFGNLPARSAAINTVIQHENMPAIKPQRDAVPAFTLRQVTEYLKTQPEGQDPRYTLKQALFVSPDRLNAIFHNAFFDNNTRATSKLYCYIEFQTDKPINALISVSPDVKQVPQLTRTFFVFDAETGNLIARGGFA
ncbi:hypothetical protein EI42_04953 [Thermosporothrix hazakensis]|jgi:hypothetical protein|uniref:Uncharacterized protein n=1 Tax=Thermosporothrix hazakensis TaxID=644383 RepID=A0A326U3U2_THEHA|nr:hypothetical protein [Thermosporothrix hazakensis]PZW23570.1 hypothetical protein EI42_04953 [Thermosporothrix hazakensis]GCE51062.1 hypothetical protein KTH_59310 [Thermosporothrix hazakensis]